MKNFLLLTLLALLMIGCAKSYIEYTYNENIIEAPFFEKNEGEDVSDLRKDFSQPTPGWLQKTADVLGG